MDVLAALVVLALTSGAAVGMCLAAYGDTVKPSDTVDQQ